MRNESADLRNYPNEDSCFYYPGNCNWLPEVVHISVKKVGPIPWHAQQGKDWMVDTDIESFMS